MMSLASAVSNSIPASPNNKLSAALVNMSAVDISTTDTAIMRHQQPTNTSNSSYNLNSLPEKVLLKIFSFLPHREVLKCASVCRMWNSLTKDNRLWRNVYLRPEIQSDWTLQVKDINLFIRLIGDRFGDRLNNMELPYDLITTEILTELANKCPNLGRLVLDFSKAMQLNDFNELNVFPCNLRSLYICLSEVIFLEGFMRRIYTFMSSLEVLHLIGTIDKSTTDVEEEIYETINIHKIKSYTPNLKVINLYSVRFVEDYHIESIASGCIHLECLSLSHCTHLKGAPLKVLMQRCQKLRCLILRNTGIENRHFSAVAWEDCQNLEELDIGSTDLSEDCILNSFLRMRGFMYLAVPYCDGFTDNVLEKLIENQKLVNLRALDVGYTVNLKVETVFNSLKVLGPKLKGLVYTGNIKVTEQFWTAGLSHLRNIRLLIMGTPFGWFRRISTRIHIDSVMEAIAQMCFKIEHLEVQWDPETLRWTENSSKFIDHLRLRCAHLQTLSLADGEYFELVRSNFERAGRFNVVRNFTNYHTDIVSLLSYFDDLRFN
ncbi:hypothetical protein ACOME3_005797 [Neoechinorhynchus agilis]